ncbi:MAG: hypothetical protein ABW043_12305 [Devosia sp.]|uniref:hypothetical protein n=1 Tax=Devosia sp. TaxID=1871048 RepID=UPI00339189DC
MSSNGAVCRLAIYPRFLRNEAFDSEALFALGDLDSNGTKGFSVGDRDMLSSIEDVHGFGCRSAAVARANERQRFVTKNNREPIRFQETSHYRGFYDMDADQVRSQGSSIYDVRIVPLEENDEPAHCHVELHVRNYVMKPSDVSIKRAISLERIAILNRFARTMSPPHMTVCGEDLDIAHQIETITLPPPEAFYSEP